MALAVDGSRNTARYVIRAAVSRAAGAASSMDNVIDANRAADAADRAGGVVHDAACSVSMRSVGMRHEDRAARAKVWDLAITAFKEAIAVK